MKVQLKNYHINVRKDGSYEPFNFNTYLKELLETQNMNEWYKDHNYESFQKFVKDNLKSRIDNLEFGIHLNPIH